MAKRGDGVKCGCKAVFDSADKPGDTCHCTVMTEHPSGICHFCRGETPFGPREPAHTGSGYQGRLRKLPQYSGKATD